MKKILLVFCLILTACTDPGTNDSTPDNESATFEPTTVEVNTEDGEDGVTTVTDPVDPTTEGETPEPEPSTEGETPEPEPSTGGETPEPEPSTGGSAVTDPLVLLGEMISDNDDAKVAFDGSFVHEGITFTFINGRNLNGENVFMINSGGALYNSTSLGSIQKIEIAYRSGGSGTSQQSFAFADSEISTKPSTYSTVLQSSVGGTTGSVVAPSAGLGFFRMDVSNKNLQATTIKIYLH